jgi:hypothetical protein
LHQADGLTNGDIKRLELEATTLIHARQADLTLQSGVDTTIGSASLACSDPLETVTISSITPASTADLTLKVKLRGPDGAFSSEITAIVPSAQIAVSIQTVRSIYATNASGTTKTGGFNPDSSASSLLVALPFDSYTDVSASINAGTYAKTVSPKSGSSILTTASAKFYGITRSSVNGNSSVLVTNMPSNYLSGDFTFEAWVRPAYRNGGHIIFGSDPVWRGLWLAISTTDFLFRASNGSPGNVVVMSATVSMPTDQWVHLAATKGGGTYTVYVNGTARATATNATPLTGYNTTLNVGGGRLAATSGGFDENDDFGGYTNDVRVYTSCKYTANFTV